MPPFKRIKPQPWHILMRRVYNKLSWILLGLRVPHEYHGNHSPNVHIGRGTWIAHTAALVPHYHNLHDPNISGKTENIYIGNNCWIGQNATILKGVKLGDHTIVAAGAVVTKSFPEGHMILAGIPANPIKHFTKTVDIFRCQIIPPKD